MRGAPLPLHGSSYIRSSDRNNEWQNGRHGGRPLSTGRRNPAARPPPPAQRASTGTTGRRVPPAHLAVADRRVQCCRLDDRPAVTTLTSRATPIAPIRLQTRRYGAARGTTPRGTRQAAGTVDRPPAESSTSRGRAAGGLGPSQAWGLRFARCFGHGRSGRAAPGHRGRPAEGQARRPPGPIGRPRSPPAAPAPPPGSLS
jgi:hypothetical protein